MFGENRQRKYISMFMEKCHVKSMPRLLQKLQRKKDIRRLALICRSMGKGQIALYACSLGAFFSLHTYSDRKIEKCLFQSPIVDMEYLIRQMFLWFQVTEERLCAEKEIPTPVDTLRWDYYQYVREHPVCDWRIPTAILYGGKDNMQPAEVIRNFAQRYSCDLTISRDSEHAFMQDNDKGIVEKWLEKNI